MIQVLKCALDCSLRLRGLKTLFNGDKNSYNRTKSDAALLVQCSLIIPE